MSHILHTLLSVEVIIYLIFGLYGLQVTVILAHFLDKGLFKCKDLIELTKLLGHLSLPQSMLGSEGLWGVLGLEFSTAGLKRKENIDDMY